MKDFEEKLLDASKKNEILHSATLRL